MNKHSISKITTAMKTLFEAVSEDKCTLSNISSSLKENNSQIGIISEKIGKFDEPISGNCLKEHLKDVTLTMEGMADVTTNLIEVGLDRHRDIVSEINEKFNIKRKKIKLYKKIIIGLTNVHKQGRIKSGRSGVGKGSNARQQPNQLIKQNNTFGQCPEVIEVNSNVKELSSQETQTEIQNLCELNEDICSKVLRIENDLVSKFKLKIKTLEIQQVPQVNNTRKKMEQNSRIVEKNPRQKNCSSEKIQILEDVAVSNFDATLNLQIFQYNKSVTLSNTFSLEQHRQSVKRRKELTLKKPKIKIVGMYDDWDDEMLIKKLKEQNHFMANSDLKIVQKFKGLRGSYNVVLEVSDNSFTKILEAGTVRIHFENCRVLEDINIYRCYKCCGYNHKARDCSSLYICKYCAGNHDSRTCTSEYVVCINCKKAAEISNMNLDVNHTAFDNSCVIYKRKLEVARQRIDYRK